MKPMFTILILMHLFLINCYSNQANLRNINIADLAYRGDLYEISIEVARGGFIDQRDSFQRKYTALMVASREGDYRLVEWLIENGANVNSKTKDGHTALMYAAYNRYPDIVKLLIKKGADINYKTIQGHTALSEVMETDKQTIIDLLIQAGAMEDKKK